MVWAAATQAFNSTGELWSLFLSGDLFNAALGAFTLVLGSWFYLFAVIFMDVLLFMRSQSLTVPAVVSVALVGAFYAFLPSEAVAVVSVLATAFFAVALLRFFTGGD